MVNPNYFTHLKKILDIPVFNTITGTELIKRLKNNILNKSTIKLNHRVNKIEKLDDGFHIDNEFLTKTVIIATGTGSFKPKKISSKNESGN